MKKIICLCGISGSGKSTYAKTLIAINNELFKKDSIIINRDKLRELFYGYTEKNVNEYYLQKDIKKLEDFITKQSNLLIKEALKEDKIVIVDNTNLNIKYINDLKSKFWYANIEFVPIEIDLQTCIERDLNRTRQVGESVIKKQYESFKNLKKTFDFKSYEPNVQKIKNDPLKEKVVIFDIDGTLALKTSNRSFYDHKAVVEDSLNMPVFSLYESLYKENKYKIIICSGRDEKSRPYTEQWLKDKNIFYHHLYMRKENDMRGDNIVKGEIWNEISKQYFIEYIVDDRLRVIEAANELGLFCFNVNQTNKEF